MPAICIMSFTVKIPRLYFFLNLRTCKFVIKAIPFLSPLRFCSSSCLNPKQFLLFKADLRAFFSRLNILRFENLSLNGFLSIWSTVSSLESMWPIFISSLTLAYNFVVRRVPSYITTMRLPSFLLYGP